MKGTYTKIATFVFAMFPAEQTLRLLVFRVKVNKKTQIKVWQTMSGQPILRLCLPDYKHNYAFQIKFKCCSDVSFCLPYVATLPLSSPAPPSDVFQ